MQSSDKKVTVVVADDHPFFRDGVTRGLLASGLITVVGEAGTGREALELIGSHHPDVALVDYQMPDLDGLQVVHSVNRDGLTTRVLLLSAITDSAIVFQALQEGAAGYLGKDARRSQIVDAVLSVAAGKTVVPAELAGALAGEIRLRAQPTGPVLSERASGAAGGRPRAEHPAGRCRAIHRGEHGEDPHPAALRETRRLRPGRRGGRGDAPRPAGLAPGGSSCGRFVPAAALCSVKR